MNFCTYFDSKYAHKGWVCYNTLHNFLGNGLQFYVLCLDEAVYDDANTKERVIPIKLSDIEQYEPRLLDIKGSRQAKEYYATMSPILPQYIMDTFGTKIVFYTDADIAFWSDPTEMLDVLGVNSLMVVDHGIEPPRSGVRFNVGILAYRNDADCKEFLEWWTDKCIEWCEWITLPDGRMADQGYLNILHDEPDKFKHHISCPHPGVNMGPWNIGKHYITERNGKPIVDGKWNLICYHYHEFKVTGPESYFPTGWQHTQSDKRIVYDPYFKLIKKSMDGKL